MVYLVPAHISSVLSAFSFSRLADIHWLIAEMHCSSAFTDDNTLLRSQCTCNWLSSANACSFTPYFAARSASSAVYDTIRSGRQVRSARMCCRVISAVVHDQQCRMLLLNPADRDQTLGMDRWLQVGRCGVAASCLSAVKFPVGGLIVWHQVVLVKELLQPRLHHSFKYLRQIRQVRHWSKVSRLTSVQVVLFEHW